MMIKRKRVFSKSVENIVEFFVEIFVDFFVEIFIENLCENKFIIITRSYPEVQEKNPVMFVIICCAS